MDFRFDDTTLGEMDLVWFFLTNLDREFLVWRTELGEVIIEVDRKIRSIIPARDVEDQIPGFWKEVLNVVGSQRMDTAGGEWCCIFWLHGRHVGMEDVDVFFDEG